VGNARRQSRGDAAGGPEDRFSVAATLGFVAGLALSEALDAVAPGKIVRVARRMAAGQGATASS
jgi:hypothetical protein